ncbi:uncharacterized protein A4U43_C04F32440 [Asparagus officinalis]|uniref:Uncharacterized protein n=1 Tax=Asparagus officinalis TaxID=4686 RepID=A0A5P1F559_ASPOF|nr:uncharacterized protein A4U43_C04F32440 [Asparagus officinalis]
MNNLDYNNLSSWGWLKLKEEMAVEVVDIEGGDDGGGVNTWRRSEALRCQGDGNWGWLSLWERVETSRRSKWRGQEASGRSSFAAAELCCGGQACGSASRRSERRGQESLRRSSFATTELCRASDLSREGRSVRNSFVRIKKKW